MGPTNNGKSDYIDLDGTPGIFQVLNRCSMWLTFMILLVLILLCKHPGGNCGGNMLFACWRFIRWIQEAVNWLGNKLYQPFGFCGQKLATAINWLGNKFFDLFGNSRRPLATELIYCQKDLSDNGFETFCRKFIQDILLKKLNVDEPTDERIFMVLELPSKNRQNILDVLCNDITIITEKYSLEGKDDIVLIQISFDGNNIDDPPNLMTDKTFKRIEQRLQRKFVSYINIVYTGKHQFKDCNINRDAARKLRLLSKKKN